MKIDLAGRYLGPQRFAVLAGVVAVYAASILLWLVVPGLYQSASEWDPYHIVTTTRSPADARDRLLEAESGDFVTEIVTAETTEVLVTRFSSLERVTLSDALRQLDPLDPRRDPFIEGLSRYFTGEPDGQSLIYLRSDEPTRRVAGVVRRALGAGSRVVGWEPLRTLVGAGLFLLAAAAVVARQGQFRLIVIAGLAPWLPVVVGGGISGAVGAALICVSWSQALTNLTLLLERREPGRKGLVSMLRQVAWPSVVVVAALGIIWGNSGPRAVVAALIAVAGLLAVSAVVFLFRLGSLIHRDHDLFAPVSILTGKAAGLSGQPLGGSRVIVALLLVVFVVIPPVADRIIAASSPVVPGTVAIDGNSGVSYQSIEELWSRRPPDALVDLSDYAAHRAYQQALAFGRDYSPPTEDEVVTLSRFRETEEGAYSRYGEDVLTFDAQWLNDAISEPPAGIAAILVSTGEASGVVPTQDRGLYSGYSQLLKHTAYVLLALIPAALSGHRLPAIRRGGFKVVEIARRRKQVA